MQGPSGGTSQDEGRRGDCTLASAPSASSSRTATSSGARRRVTSDCIEFQAPRFGSKCLSPPTRALAEVPGSLPIGRCRTTPPRLSGPGAERSGGIRIRNPFRNVCGRRRAVGGVTEWIPDRLRASRGSPSGMTRGWRPEESLSSQKHSVPASSTLLHLSVSQSCVEGYDDLSHDGGEETGHASALFVLARRDSASPPCRQKSGRTGAACRSAGRWLRRSRPLVPPPAPQDGCRDERAALSEVVRPWSRSRSASMWSMWRTTTACAAAASRRSSASTMPPCSSWPQLDAPERP